MTNEDPEERLQCEHCILDAMVTILMANTSQEILTGLNSLKDCSLEYLSAQHDECIEDTEARFAENKVEMLKEMQRLQECGTRIVVRNILTGCLTVLDSEAKEDGEKRLENFLTVDRCSQAVAD